MKRKNPDGSFITHDGTILHPPVYTKPRTRLIDILPSPEEIAKGVNTGPSDEATNASWLYGDAGKAPR